MALYKDKKIDSCFTDKTSGRVTVRKDNQYKKFNSMIDMDEYVSSTVGADDSVVIEHEEFPQMEDYEYE